VTNTKVDKIGTWTLASTPFTDFFDGRPSEIERRRFFEKEAWTSFAFA
jgi:hypothetical protein